MSTLKTCVRRAEKNNIGGHSEAKKDTHCMLQWIIGHGKGEIGSEMGKIDHE